MKGNIENIMKEKQNLEDLLFKLTLKNGFVSVFVKIENSKEYSLYLNLLEEVKNADEMKKQELNKKIDYMKQYGPVSDYLYLIEHCDDVKNFIKIRNEVARIDAQIKGNQTNNIVVFDDAKKKVRNLA